MEEKIALITGGTRGIGDAISQVFLEKDFFVIAASRNEEKNEKWLEEKKKQGFQKIATVICNVADYSSCEKMAKEVQEKYKAIDVLVNNAGITKDSSFKKMTKDMWETVIQTDLNSLYHVTHPLLPLIEEKGEGRIINISSVNGRRGQFGQTNYSAAKAGVHGFTKALALELAKKKITVNTVSPGYVDTEMILAIPEDIRQKLLQTVPMGRFCSPKEVAHLVAFLASKEASYITGGEFTINGGLHMF